MFPWPIHWGCILQSGDTPVGPDPFGAPYSNTHWHSPECCFRTPASRGTGLAFVADSCRFQKKLPRVASFQRPNNSLISRANVDFLKRPEQIIMQSWQSSTNRVFSTSMIISGSVIECNTRYFQRVAILQEFRNAKQFSCRRSHWSLIIVVEPSDSDFLGFDWKL